MNDIGSVVSLRCRAFMKNNIDNKLYVSCSPPPRPALYCILHAYDVLYWSLVKIHERQDFGGPPDSWILGMKNEEELLVLLSLSIYL